MATPRRKPLKGSDSAASPYILSSSPAADIPRSSSTPYDLYNARSQRIAATANRAKADSGSSSPSPSPFVSSSRFGTPHVPRQSFQNRGWAVANGTPADSNSPISRKGSVVASPSLRAATSGVGTPTRSYVSGRADGAQGAGESSKQATRQKRISRAFVRRRTIRQRFESLPVDLLDRLTSLSFTVSEHLQDPALGYPIGFALHLLSLISHLASPTSELSLALLFGVDASSSMQTASVFGTSGVGGIAGGTKGKGGIKELRKAAKAARANTWSWMAATLSFALVVVACYNAYVLFSSRRKYRLWMRKQEEKLASENARLVPVHLDNEEGEPSRQDRLRAFILEKLNDLPIVNWFTPDTPDLHEGHHHLDAHIHELDVWESPEVPLRIVTVYSPLHACLWHFAGSSLLPIGGFLAWTSLFVVMALVSVQAYVLVTAFVGLVKDKSLLAAEVMREYDQRFVLPRAMPEVRDACIQTSQAETITQEDWMASPGAFSSRDSAFTRNWRKSGGGGDSEHDSERRSRWRSSLRRDE